MRGLVLIIGGLLCLHWWLFQPTGIPAVRAQEPAASGSSTTRPNASASARAEQTLRNAGLVPSNRFWITADEAELRRQLGLLPRFEKAFYSAQQQFRTLQGQYQTTRGQLQTSRTKLKEILDLLGQNSTGSLQRQQLESESQRINEQISQAEKVIEGRLDVLDESSEMTKATIDLVNAQNEVAICLLDIRHRTAALPISYQQLNTESRIQESLSKLAGSGALGPMENYALLTRRLERLEGQVFADGVPFYRRSGQIRITAILNERLPVTFSYSGPTGPTLLPSSLIAGMHVDLSSAPPGEVVQLKEEAIPTRRIVLPSLRLGKHVWQEVSVDVLPPEAEHLGARISGQPFAPQQSKIQEGKLWFSVQK